MAGEAYFTAVKVPAPAPGRRARRRFVFGVSVAARDRAVLETLRAFLGAGSIYHQPRRRSAWQPEAIFTINSIRGHLRATIPFADRYLVMSHKRKQYLEWKATLESYVIDRNVRWGRGRSTCTDPDCDKPVRARNLCRVHYYRATGY